jgi:intracellular multiplication protein IcmD
MKRFSALGNNDANRGALLGLVALILLFSASSAWAEAAVDCSALGSTDTLGHMARNLMCQFKDIGRLMISLAYLSGIGFGIGAIFKFKQHKDNPTQIPIGTPFSLLALSVLLVFLPGIYAPAGHSIFGTGEDHTAGGFTGSGVSGLPGYH